MEALATTAGALSLPFLSPNKYKDAPFSRIVRFSTPPKVSRPNLNHFSVHNLQDAAMSLVLSAGSVRGWTTGSGIEGPTVPAGQDSVFVQCCGCNIFHKLVDNLNLFHEMKCYVNSSFNQNPIDNMNFNYLDLDEDNNGDIFPHF